MTQRIDETTQRIDKTAQRIDKTTQQIDETKQRIDETKQRIDKTAQRIDKTAQRIDKTAQQIDETKQRIDETKQAIVGTRQPIVETKRRIVETKQARVETKQARVKSEEWRSPADVFDIKQTEAGGYDLTPPPLAVRRRSRQNIQSPEIGLSSPTGSRAVGSSLRCFSRAVGLESPTYVFGCSSRGVHREKCAVRSSVTSALPLRGGSKPVSLRSVSRTKPESCSWARPLARNTIGQSRSISSPRPGRLQHAWVSSSHHTR
jgi:uncharacterized protein YukE